MAELISIKEFAQRLDVSLRTIKRHLASGTFAEVGQLMKDGARYIDFDSGKRAWESIGGGSHHRSNIRIVDKDEKTVLNPVENECFENQNSGEPVDDPGGSLDISDNANLNEAKRLDAIYSARLKRQKYEKEAGILVESEQVKKVQHEWAQVAAAKIGELPERIVDFVMSAKDRNDALIYLEDAVDSIKEYLSTVEIIN